MDGEGAVVKSYDYDEFGVTTSTGDTFFNEVTFTGSIADASGLLYMNARYYNPATARFLSQDTYTGSASVPWTQHLYAYCNNNPVNMVDPTGHAPVGPMRKNMVCINDGGSGLSSYELMERSVTPEPQPQPASNTDAGTLLTDLINYIFEHVDVRLEETEDKWFWGFPGLLEIRHTVTVGQSNIYDRNGIFPIIGTGSDGMFGGLAVYHNNRFEAITFSHGAASTELGYGDFSISLKIPVAVTEYLSHDEMVEAALEITQYTSNGAYTRHSFIISMHPLLACAVALFYAPGTVPALLIPAF